MKHCLSCFIYYITAKKIDAVKMILYHRIIRSVNSISSCLLNIIYVVNEPKSLLNSSDRKQILQVYCALKNFPGESGF